MQAMRRGDFAAAWAETDRIEHERRALERAGRLVWQDHYLLWNGEAFDGCRVLIQCNHGMGDTLQFLRFVPMVWAVAHSVTLWVQPPLVPLLCGTEEFGDVRNGWSDSGVSPPAGELEIEIMELAYAFRCTASTLPADAPYLPLASLHPHCAKLPILPRGDETRVGLLWAASDWDPRRSIPLQALEPLFQIPGVRFYNFQQGPHANDHSASASKLVPLFESTREVIQAAAAMLEMDLILTVDSMAAHLAGALGRPVWLLLRHEADWRWLTGRTDSPWYPTMRIYRQPREGAWESVVANVVRDLRRIHQPHHPPMRLAGGSTPTPRT